MPEPRADGVEVDPGLQQMAGAGVTDGMRRNRLCDQRRYTGRSSLNEAINAQPGIGFAMATEEDGVAIGSFPNEFGRMSSVRGHNGHCRILPPFPQGVTSAWLQSHCPICNVDRARAGADLGIGECGNVRSSRCEVRRVTLPARGFASVRLASPSWIWRRRQGLVSRCGAGHGYGMDDRGLFSGRAFWALALLWLPASASWRRRWCGSCRRRGRRRVPACRRRCCRCWRDRWSWLLPAACRWRSVAGACGGLATGAGPGWPGLDWERHRGGVGGSRAARTDHDCRVCSGSRAYPFDTDTL